MKKIIILLIILSPVICLKSQWINQPVPITYNGVYDLRFFDSNTGIIASGGGIYRTTDGGNDWKIVSNTVKIYKLDIIDSTTVYGCGNINLTVYGAIFRSYDRGLSWDSVGIRDGIYTGISFVNRDTGWISAWIDGPGILYTTNGGITLSTQTTDVGYGQIFFLKEKINNEYYGWATGYHTMYKTTNSGNTWYWISDLGPGAQLFFLNENTGWFAGGSYMFWNTSNGGYNWNSIYLPTGGGIFSDYLRFFDITSNDTLYGSGGSFWYGPGRVKGIIWKTTNSGNNWGYQQPDTSFPYNQYAGMDFIDSKTGWTSNLKTTNGGGPIITSVINPNWQTKSELPAGYRLGQNYPNPFNSQTSIEFSIPAPSLVTLTVYDIMGKEVMNICRESFFSPGRYKTTVDFENIKSSSGVYIYRIVVYDKNTGTAFTDSKKLILLK